jgi:hypothetical protein
MAHRAEEKARLRAERVAREEAERKASARKQRLSIVGGLLAVLAVVGVGAALALGGGDDSNGDGGSGPAKPSGNLPTLPVQEVSDYEEAAKLAGCELKHPAIEGANHDPDKEFKASDYQSNPPHSGDHSPTWYEDGIYEPGSVPHLGMLVHTLEHGRIDVQYKPGTPAADVLKLEAFMAEQEDGYHMLLFENTTEMPYAVAATAWGHVLGCNELNDKTWDALRTFRARYIDKGPEQVP